MTQPTRRQEARTGRGGRPALLTRERIVTAAVDVLDAEGLDALTMRRVGAQLGVAAMSLYRHVPNRDALLAAVVDHLFAEAVAEPLREDGWADALIRFAAAYRGTLLAHPHAVPLLATHPVDVETGTALLAGLLERFAASGIEPQDALLAVQSVGVYVLGHALAQVGTPPGTDEPPPPADTDTDTDTGDAAAAFYDHWFDTGLRAMVTGFEHRLTGISQGASRPTPTTRTARDAS
ncbi:TetR/AcrR family transcriptional regulator [Nonomuraea pusilla]|uniref:Transcriptional regulator, TetR family n=1 Tax=Nonomuraea pusilla TaxID=46177 RepID=A0A1H7P5M2_9ACTN|nr:TetR family transcriptional regulator [Nonomuraea pusilla]SEL30658.1 transcriptional regulator, TetR family [Nonomuraea pusilla]